MTKVLPPLHLFAILSPVLFLIERTLDLSWVGLKSGRSKILVYPNCVPSSSLPLSLSLCPLPEVGSPFESLLLGAA